jgi:DNA-binding MurR/RpiR family transcriptional regulator
MANATRYEDLTRTITDAYPALPNRLQSIARFALGNPDPMALATVAEIARNASVPPSGMLRKQVAPIGRGDVLVAASFRNYTPAVIEAADLARKQRARVIAITDHPVSPLARAAHVRLEIGDDPAVQFRTLVAALCAAQALVMQVGFGVTRS